MTEPGVSSLPAVLLVEDDAHVRKTLTLVLEQSGFTVRPAACGAEAVDVFRRQRADIALVDMHMPRMDGLQTLSALRALAPGLVCCLMGGHIDEGERARLFQAGAAAVLDKPLLLKDLAGTLRRLLGVQGPSAPR
jgi:CheY-like chemotaxis protein